MPIIKDVRSYQLLLKAVAEQSHLEGVYLTVDCEQASQLGMDIFHRIRPSIQRFSYLPFCSSDQWNRKLPGDEDVDLVTSKRQGPLKKLIKLDLWDLGEEDTSTDSLDIFAHIPNVKDLRNGDVIGNHDIEAIGRFVGRECSKLRRSRCQPKWDDAYDFLPYVIMGGLPHHQIIDFQDSGFCSDLSHPIASVAIQQHSAILRHLELLEDLVKEISEEGGGIYIDLTDAQGSPWKCTKLCRLSLSISGCELPPVDAENLPYYDRETPIALFQAETYHFAKLERFYLQIGRLAELRELCLQMVKLDEHGPGYLGHFSGLSKLKKLKGSFRADTKGTKIRMGWKEALWIYERWPDLECVELFGDMHIEAPLLWLRNQARHAGRAHLLLGCNA
ncbi:hypothetical protein BG015_001636 [Linnemannia schmuckeri]|uniref:Uncharacterized protein n=1 Tax=Linnemannia schmuckeri TaxID=64567 RepID=A0A9P5VFP8_9FUNG|nr:hypothetical protein BG015_001636 [Linnemannia schmuckeri]